MYIISFVNENERGIPAENKDLVRYQNGIVHNCMHHPVHHFFLASLSEQFVYATPVFSLPFVQSSSFAR